MYEQEGEKEGIAMLQGESERGKSVKMWQGEKSEIM